MASTPSPTSTHWLNLTNGIEALLLNVWKPHEVRFMRLQSSHCEQKRWDLVLNSVPDEMLLRLALGESCFVHDYGARKEVPRAIWQGLEFVKYVLSRRWLDLTYAPVGRAATAGGYFSWHYHKVLEDDRLKKRLDYHKSFLVTDRIHLYAMTGATNHDGDRAWYKGILTGEVQRVREDY